METVYDPTDPAHLRDPYATFADMRGAGGVHWCEPLSGWIALDWASVQTVITTPRVFSANRLLPVHERLSEDKRATAADVLRWLSLWMVFQDPPNHTRLRRYLSTVINPRMVESLRASITDITADLFDGLPKDRPIDFFTEVALTLPGYVVMDLLGVPRDRLAEVKQWSDEMMLFIGSSRGVENKYERARHGAYSMAELFRQLIDERRSHPKDDALTRMITTEVDGETLTEDELIASMMMIGNGAQDTTAHLLTNGLIALHQRPEVAAKLTADVDGLIVSAVDEFLRFDSPVLSTGRLVAADTELGGQQLKEGDRIFAMLAAANRDPAVFDSPDEIVLEGRPNGHLAFSKGVHFCLGAPLARLEGQIAFRHLLERFPGLRIAEPLETIPWSNSLVSRGPLRLPVVLGGE
ncbi:cytochrome P450 [Amycolatopsis sp.]|uniref:cytochrome P450 n=1 Tax=Amycolatopsis sp. TaxID=37632 RepID=UPI002C054C26|nr:cytochrome P450 [Amycolatopsis sp.]HVV09306.1 cytochrome P450 [Amycolatopsis sp.]